MSHCLSPGRQTFWYAITLAIAALAMVLSGSPAHAQATWARPYVSGGPNNYPSSLGNTINSVYLVDPVTGNPITPAGNQGGAPAGLSLSNSVGTTSATMLTAGLFPHWVTIENTHATQTLYVSFNNPATTSGFAIAPGAALTLPTAFANGLFCIGSGAGTTYALIGY